MGLWKLMFLRAYFNCSFCYMERRAVSNTMKYYIQCKDFTQAYAVSLAFSKHYKKNYINGGGKMRNGYITVDIDQNEFVFFYEGTRPNPINVDDFVKKYFGSQKKQSLK